MVPKRTTDPDVPANSDSYFLSQFPCVSGAGTGDAAAVVRAEDQRSWLRDLLPVCAVEYLRVTVFRGIELGNSQLRQVATGLARLFPIQKVLYMVKYSLYSSA